MFKGDYSKPVINHNLGLHEPNFYLLPNGKILIKSYSNNFHFAKKHNPTNHYLQLSTLEFNPKPKPRVVRFPIEIPKETCYTPTGQFFVYDNLLGNTMLQCHIPDFYIKEFTNLSNERRRLLLQSSTTFPAGVAQIIGEYAGLFADKSYYKVNEEKEANSQLQNFSGQKRKRVSAS